MLPEALRNTNENRHCKSDSNWENYLLKIGSYASTIDHQFLSQICYEHYDRFNDYFPKFDLKKNRIERIQLSTAEIYENVRYDFNDELDYWYFMIDDYFDKQKLDIFQKYKVLNYVIKNKTWSFPPVVIKNEIARTLGNKCYGEPIHLFEGTHRISFIRRLYEREEIEANSKHELFMIK